MTIKTPVHLSYLPHLSSQELLGDIWFYRPECQYVKDAWLEYPDGYDPSRLIDNESEKTFFRAHGQFSIPASFYVKQSDASGEYAALRHFNAVDANICFNQLAYVMLLEGCDKNLLNLCDLGFHPDDSRSRRSMVNMMISKINTTFVRPIAPNDFEGWVAARKIYKRKDLPFIDIEFQFEDKKGGLAVGTCRGVIFV